MEAAAEIEDDVLVQRDAVPLEELLEAVARSGVAVIVLSFAFSFTELAKMASDLPFIMNWSIRRSSFSVQVLRRLRDDEAVERVVDLGCHPPSGRRPGTRRRGSSA